MPPNANVVLVYPIPWVADVMEEDLLREGHTVMTARTGDEAFSILNELVGEDVTPDVVLINRSVRRTEDGPFDDSIGGEIASQVREMFGTGPKVVELTVSGARNGTFGDAVYDIVIDASRIPIGEYISELPALPRKER